MKPNEYKSKNFFTKRTEPILFVVIIISLSLIVFSGESYLTKISASFLLVYYITFKVSVAYPLYQFKEEFLLKKSFPVKKEVYSNGLFFHEVKYTFNRTILESKEISQIEEIISKSDVHLKVTTKNGRKVVFRNVDSHFLNKFYEWYVPNI